MASRTKTCKKCGWVYPYDIVRTRCAFCKTDFTEGLCVRCGTDTDDLRIGLCPECSTKSRKAAARRLYDKSVAAVQNEFDNWMDLVKRIPADYPTLTNEQWIEACVYFDGCALCKSSHINTRGFFIPFRVGGRYSKWNVIPLCEDCAKRYTSVDNPFRSMHRSLGKQTHRGNISEHWHNSEKRLQKIVDYLRPRLEEAANER